MINSEADFQKNYRNRHGITDEQQAYRDMISRKKPKPVKVEEPIEEVSHISFNDTRPQMMKNCLWRIEEYLAGRLDIDRAKMSAKNLIEHLSEIFKGK